MIIKKFIGKTEEEAVEAARKELGEGVVIMNVKSVKRKGLFGSFRAKQVEVTVALEDDRENLAQVKRAQAPRPEQTAAVESGQSVKVLSSAIDGSADIEKKLDSLQTLLEHQLSMVKQEEKNTESVKNPGTASGEEETETDKDSQEDKKTKEASEQDKFVKLLYNTLIENEVDEKYANEIMEEADRNRKPGVPFDHILANVYQKMVLKFGKSEGITPGKKRPGIVYFIGPTGVGKTTTIAKLASCFVMEEKKKVALVTTDTYRIAAAEQLHTYANILEVPFTVVYGEEEMAGVVEGYKDFDYIFVDTAGHSHQNDSQLEQMGHFLTVCGDKVTQQVFLVLSATTKYNDLKKIADKYKRVTPFQLIFTKLDETTNWGNLYNIKMYADTPIAYVTYGQNVPDDIERFQPQKTVKQLLGGKR